MIKLARCCNPVPGRRHSGLYNQREEASRFTARLFNVVNLPDHEKARFIEVEWEDLKAGKSYDAEICIVGSDRKRYIV